MIINIEKGVISVEKQKWLTESVTTDLWRRLSIYVVIPCLILAGINAYNLWNEHWEHWEHLPPLEERVEYPYQNIRTKNYFFGDGDKVCSGYRAVGRIRLCTDNMHRLCSGTIR